MTRPRIVIADDHALFLDALRALLEPEFNVVGIATDGRMLLAECARLTPDVVLLDISMPLLNGLDAGRRLKVQDASTKLIYVTMSGDPQDAGAALRAGASGYVLKTSAATELMLAIRQGIQGRSYITPLIAREAIESLMDELPGPQELTLHQRELLQLLAEGRSMKEAAAILNITMRTVASQKYRIMQRLRIKSSAELVQFAMKQGIVS